MNHSNRQSQFRGEHPGSRPVDWRASLLTGGPPTARTIMTRILHTRGSTDKSLSRSSLSKMLQVLDLFNEHNAVVSVDTVSSELGYTRSTTYRYLKVLCDAGLLTSLGKGLFCLGSRIIALERLILLNDPLLLVGQPAMAQVVARNPSDILLLCSLYRDKVVCIHQEGPKNVMTAEGYFPPRRTRGVPFPLFKGAASLAILAFFPIRAIQSIYLNDQKEIADAGLGETWLAFRKLLKSISRAGYASTPGDPLAGIAAPIFNSERKVVASLMLLRRETTDSAKMKAVERVIATAETISKALAKVM